MNTYINAGGAYDMQVPHMQNAVCVPYVNAACAYSICI